jgi:hypothetical protein
MAGEWDLEKKWADKWDLGHTVHYIIAESHAITNYQLTDFFHYYYRMLTFYQDLEAVL